LARHTVSPALLTAGGAAGASGSAAARAFACEREPEATT
jgi:hypothetical protein